MAWGDRIERIEGSALRSSEGGAGTASGVAVAAPAGDIPDCGLGCKQLRLQLVVTSLERAAVRARAALAVGPVAVALQVAAVEEVRLVAEAAGDPLPAEVVAGGIAVQQVFQEPVGPRFPVHPAPVHQIGRHPHPRVVVEPAAVHQIVSESIHAGQSGAAFAQVVGKVPAVTGGIVPGLQLLLTLKDGAAEIDPHPLPEITPTQFIDQLAAVVPALAAIPQLGKDHLSDLRQGENAMANPGGQAGDSTLEMVAAASIALGIHPLQLAFGC